MAAIDFDKIKADRIIESIIRDYSEETRAMYVIERFKLNPKLLLSKRGVELFRECRLILRDSEIFNHEYGEDFKRMWLKETGEKI